MFLLLRTVGEPQEKLFVVRMIPIRKKLRMEAVEEEEEKKRKMVNTSAMYSLVSDLLRSEEHYDVTIQVEDRVFRASRLHLAALSEYFNTMFFSSKFNETKKSRNEVIVLRDIDAASFENVLNFMYTGNVVVTDSNVYALLRTCDFLILRFPYIEARCSEHLRNRVQPIENGLDLFAFACVRKKAELIQSLSQHICKHLKHFTKDVAFMDVVSLEGLNALLKCKTPSCRDENILLNTVIRWIHHARGERKIHREELMKNIDFTKVSANYVEFMLKEYEHFMDRVTPDVNAAANPVEFFGNEFSCESTPPSVAEDSIRTSIIRALLSSNNKPSPETMRIIMQCIGRR